ncbi:MAG: hypothetical protein KC635_04920 [Myxococcales bacterium]|nr:hypothetical protein [Myxococcales bacterium]MCB9736045.1 hypothetical protein [Deltaproteobacteria bacterium]
MKHAHAPLTAVATLEQRFSALGRAARRLEGRALGADLETLGEFLILRESLFAALDLPMTAHNSLRLFDVAIADHPLEVFLADVDHHFPSALFDDGDLFASALAVFFAWRGVTEADARVYDAEAFLRVAHHPHNTAAIGAWLAGRIDWVALRASVSADAAFLERAVA